MQVVLLAGGLGTRISEESYLRPKPMIEIGEKPILWHIMKHYDHYGFKGFTICCGYKQEMIREWFSNYLLHNKRIMAINTSINALGYYDNGSIENWGIFAVDTGLNTPTGERIKMLMPPKYLDKYSCPRPIIIDEQLLGSEENFLMTYGDGVSDVNLKELVKFHKKHKRLVTMTLARPRGRFGAVNIDKNGLLMDFREKAVGDDGWVNSGYFVINKKALKYIKKGEFWEKEPMQRIVKQKQAIGYKHTGFWHAMDTIRDKNILEELWKTTKPWKVWK